MKNHKLGLNKLGLSTAVTALLLLPFPSAHAQSGPSDPDAINYSSLYNAPYSYADLKQAKSRDFSDTQIAKMAKIADMTGMPFRDIVNAVRIQGKSFLSLANEYGFPLSALDDVKKEKDDISNFMSASETSGKYAGSQYTPSPMASDNIASGGMSGGGMASNMNNTMPMATGDVVAVAMANPRLSMLVKALQAAGLVDTLKGPGPFTIFAPTNRAFSMVPKAQRDALMADPAALKSLLTYHVISGQKIDAATAMSMTSPTSPPTVQGGTLNVTTSNGKVMVNNATVTKADIPASNGIIHIIDHVLMPPTTP